MAEAKLSILFPDGETVRWQVMGEETWHDLGLDEIVRRVTALPQEQELIRRVMTSLTDDPAVSRFRADVFDDLLRHPEITRQLGKLLAHVKMFYDYGVVNRREGDEAGIWDLMHRLEDYHDYILTVEAIRACLEEQDLRSEGLLRLRGRVEEIYRDNGFAGLKQDVEEARAAASEVRSVTVGINLNDRFEAVNMGLVSVNRRPFTRSGLLRNFVSAVSPRDDIRTDGEAVTAAAWYPASAEEGGVTGAMETLARGTVALRNPILYASMAAIPREDGAERAPRTMDAGASLLLSRLVRRLRELLGKHLNLSVRDMTDLIPELTFYTRWADFIRQMREKGWTFCKPEVREAAEDGSAGMEARGFWNLKLSAVLGPEAVVPNDLAFDGEKRVYLLTGANRGGKTTVTQAVGQLFLLAQSGIHVPAAAFRYAPADCVLTHFPADEDATMDLGRLGEECRRFRDLFARCTGHSLLLLNETFSTTSFEEGFYIASDAVRALLEKDTRVLYNTHMHKLAFSLDSGINTAERRGKAVSLVAASPEGTPSFRVRVAPPEGKSFARGIAQKYGVTYEQLTGTGPEGDAP